MNSPLISRRQLLSRMGHGLGGLAFADLLRAESVASSATGIGALPGMPHFAPKAKRVIFLFMNGGASHVDSFDYTPPLAKMKGKSLPESYRKGRQQLPGMSGSQTLFQLKGSTYPFKQHGQSGAWVSSAFPYTAKI